MRTNERNRETRTNGEQSKVNIKPGQTSLTIGVYFLVTRDMAKYLAIIDEAESFGISKTDYLRRLARLGRSIAQEKPYLLFARRKQPGRTLDN